MSNFETFGQVTGGIPGTAPQIFVASTPDSLAEITASGYLNDLGTKVKDNDVFFINYDDTSTQPVGGGNANEASTLGEFYVNVVGSNVNLVNALTAIGTAAAKDATDNTKPLVASVDGVFVVDDLVSAADTAGTIKDSGFSVANQLLAEPSANALTAHAGGTQAAALALTKEVNRVTTVATAADSVKLPASVAGLSITVINSGANPMQVYGAGTDTINDVATATGVSQQPNSVVTYITPIGGVAGKWYSVGLGQGFAGQLQTLLATNALTAHAGGTQAAALQLAAGFNRVTTVTSAADSVKLPASAAGMSVVVINSGTNRMQVFGAGTDTINGVATATGVSQLPNSVATYYCAVAGLWQSQDVTVGFSGNLPTESTTNAITAFAGGGQGSATLLTTSINRVTVVATAGDSVKLPVSVAGMKVTVINADASDAMDVFPNTGEVINALTANTALSVAANKTIIFFCAVAGTWNSVLTA